jgi:hypothetical protein
MCCAGKSAALDCDGAIGSFSPRSVVSFLALAGVPFW